MTLTASAWLALFLAGGIGFYTWRLADQLFGKPTAWVAAILLPVLPWFAASGFEIRPDVPMVLCILAGLYHFYCYCNKQSRRSLIISAVVMTVAFLFLQKAVFALIFIGALQLVRLIRGEQSFRDVTIYAATVATVYSLFLILLASNTALASYFFFSFTFPNALNADMGTAPNITMLVEELTRPDRLTPLVAVGLLAGVIVGRRIRHIRELTVGVLCLLVPLALVARPYDHYYLPAMPLAAIVMAYGLRCLWRKTARGGQIVLSAAVVVGCLNYVYGSLGQNVLRDHQLARIEYVLSHTHRTEAVYDGIAKFNLFRPDLDFFWIRGDPHATNWDTFNRFEAYSYDIYELIYQNDPAVISNYYIDVTKHEWILQRYRPTEMFDDLYVRVHNNTGFSFWYPYADDSGSRVPDAEQLLTSTGEIELTMVKMPDPEWNADDPPDYPYVGVVMDFHKPKASQDLSAANTLELTYKLTGPMNLILSQPDLAPGTQYRAELPVSESYTTINLQWADFHQPDWVETPSALDKRRLTGIQFEVNSAAGASATLRVRRVRFTGQNFSFGD